MPMPYDPMIGVTSSPCRIEHTQPHGLRIFVAQLENMADLDGLVTSRAAPPHLAQASPAATWRRSQKLRLEIFARRDVAQVIIVLVGAGDHVAAAFERLVRQDRACSSRPPGRAIPRSAPNHSRISSGCAGRTAASPARRGELGLAQLMIAAQQRQHRLAIRHHHQALHLRGFRQSGELADFGDRLAARACETLPAQDRLPDRRRQGELPIETRLLADWPQ